MESRRKKFSLLTKNENKKLSLLKYIFIADTKGKNFIIIEEKIKEIINTKRKRKKQEKSEIRIVKISNLKTEDKPETLNLKTEEKTIETKQNKSENFSINIPRNELQQLTCVKRVATTRRVVREAITLTSKI